MAATFVKNDQMLFENLCCISKVEKISEMLLKNYILVGLEKKLVGPRKFLVGRTILKGLGKIRRMSGKCSLRVIFAIMKHTWIRTAF